MVVSEPQPSPPPATKGCFTITVYGSSSKQTPQRYLGEARRLGELLADGGHTCMSGAGRFGCMGALNDGVEARKGKVRGVIHERWVVDGHEHPYIGQDDLQVVGGDDLQWRKKALVQSADGIIALPGGVGTWDELWEMACSLSIGFVRLPIAVVNVDGFYDGFRMQLERAAKDSLLYSAPTDLVYFASDAEEALRWVVECLEKKSQLSGDDLGEPPEMDLNAMRAHMRRQSSLKKVVRWKETHSVKHYTAELEGPRYHPSSYAVWGVVLATAVAAAAATWVRP